MPEKWKYEAADEAKKVRAVRKKAAPKLVFPTEEQIRRACAEHIGESRSALYGQFFHVKHPDGLEQAADWLQQQVIAINGRLQGQARNGH